MKENTYERKLRIDKTRETNNKKLYFAHSTRDYDTNIEKEYIEWLKFNYPDYEIINPKDIEIPEDDLKLLKGSYEDFLESMDKYFMPVVRECQLVAVFPYSKTGIISEGVQSEYMEAVINEIPAIIYER